ncbi:hypothetical protein ABT084_02650 [Streptomyces sp. NPDC002138]|uniref:hypothetical protein n=1 Tax=Streptomyces sp. NPDC002138 TaxID=3154410 RepID=UPI00331A0284
MQNDEERTGRASEPVLTTEDLAHPAPSGGRDAAVFPGEATGGTRDGAMGGPPGGGAVGAADGSGREEEYATGRDEEFEPGREAQGLSGRGEDRAYETEPGSADVVGGGEGAEGRDEPLLGATEAERYRTTWTEIQGRFVDEPQEAVRSADTLVAEVMQAFAGTLSDHRSGLEKQWDRGEEVATEDLRQALRAYRSLINRLLDT